MILAGFKSLHCFLCTNSRALQLLFNNAPLPPYFPIWNNFWHYGALKNAHKEIAVQMENLSGGLKAFIVASAHSHSPVPRPIAFFILQFVLTIIHGNGGEAKNMAGLGAFII